MLKERLADDYGLHYESSGKAHVTFYDTFDWLLFNGRFALTESNGRFCLRHYPTDLNIAEAGRQGSDEGVFWWDFPNGPLKEELRSIIDVRAALPILTLRRQSERIGLLNADQKTVLRLGLEESEPELSAGPLETYRSVKLYPVRGYGRDRAALVGRLKALRIVPGGRHILEQALASTSRKPGDYSGKLTLHLRPEQSAGAATKTILSSLLHTMQQNEAGIQSDIDTEFLHDFRVAIRRTRSALSQIKGVLRPDVRERFRTDFASLGRMSNRLRDLDVYLLRKEAHLAMLPAPLRPGLAPLFASLARERKKEQKKLAKALSNDPYRQIVAEWQAFLARDDVNEGEDASHARQPVKTLSSKLIRKKQQRILKYGQALPADAPDRDFHRLRIECKNLRYLLEFFRSLYPEVDITTLIKHLKGLQDNLGDFNDLSVQQEDLQTYLQRASASGGEVKTVAAALGGLMSVLHQRQRQIKDRFSQAFGRFAAPENLQLYGRLFGEK